MIYNPDMTVFRENRALLDAFRKGRPDALREVYFFYVDHIAMLLKSGFTEKHSGNRIRRVGDFERQRELLQDIFLRAFSNNARMGYDGLRPYKSYLTTIAGNIMIDAWRSHARDPLSSERRETEESVIELGKQQHTEAESTFESAEERLHWQRCLEASDRYIANLDRHCQDFVQLRFRDGLPQRDVGHRLNLTHSKVRTLEKRIRDNLRKHLKKLNLLEI